MATPLNVDYCNENIKKVYYKLFDEALQRYNEKQTRADRCIADYYEKIRSLKQEKPFHELILQIGDKENMGAGSENGQLARQILEKKEEFQAMSDRVENYDRGIENLETLEQVLDTSPEYQLPEPQGLMSAKSYKNKVAEPLALKLKLLVKTALIRCFEAWDSYYRLNVTNSNLHRENDGLRRTNEKLAGENENLRAENKDYKLLRKAFGSKQMDSLLEQAKAAQKSKQRDKRFKNNKKKR